MRLVALQAKSARKNVPECATHVCEIYRTLNEPSLSIKVFDEPVNMKYF